MAQKVKPLSTMRETWVQSLGWEDSLEKEMATHSSTLALKIPWMEELGAGYCPWGCKESGMTEQLHFPCSQCWTSLVAQTVKRLSVYNVRDLGSIPGLGRFPGEGNGNPLQYSCLENPMDGGAWCRLLSMGSQRVGHD